MPGIEHLCSDGRQTDKLKLKRSSCAIVTGDKKQKTTTRHETRDGERRDDGISKL